MKKKLITVISLTSAVLMASATVLALNHNHSSSTYADGIQVNGNDRTLVFDKDSNVSINSNNVSASVGKMRFFGYYGNMHSDRLFESFNSSSYFVIYYDEIVGSGYTSYQGFNEATVTSITINYHASNGHEIYFGWGNFKDSPSISIQSYGDAVTEAQVYGSVSNKELTISTGDFFDNQDNAKGSIYRCIYIRNLGEMDIYSVTVNYTCL